MKFDCTTLVFDLDGTISDPSLGITRCFNHALQNHQLPIVPEKTIAGEIGLSLDKMFLKLAPEVQPSDIPSLVTKYRQRFSEVGYSENSVYPGMPSELAHLRDSGLRLGVCTSKIREAAVKILELFDLREYFDFVDGGDIGISKKSQLAGLLNKGKIDHKAIMIGDRAIDILSAHRNGMRSMGVLWGFGSFKELSQSSPSAILEKINELRNFTLPGISD